MKHLTYKQSRFILEYLKDGNATRAVRAAYPNIKTEGGRRTMGAKLVANDGIQERIQQALDGAGLNPELLVTELKKLVLDEDKTQKNRAIRTAAEIMGLIGKGGVLATQINVDQKPLFADIMAEAQALSPRKNIA